MPKRPCSIAVTPDSKTIISADKFGDVYSLPLLPSPDAAHHAGAVPSKPRRFQANEFTVHTKNNRQILKIQQQPQPLPEATTTQHEQAAADYVLILGHVTLLTAVELAAHEGRPYILTADRDEHIRVSRGLPQAHIIEGYCLGHSEFVSRLCIPAEQPEVLVSGGGDNDLFVWDWRRGLPLSRTPLLPLVREVVGGAEKLAVSGLYSLSSRDERKLLTLFAICEQ